MGVPSSSRPFHQPLRPLRLSSPLWQHLRLRWFRWPSAHSSVALSIDLMPSSSLIGTLEEFSLLWFHKGIISEDLAKSRPCDRLSATNAMVVVRPIISEALG